MNTDKPKSKPEVGRAKIPVQRVVMHFCRMFFGWILYWLVAMAMPTSWWFTKAGLFWWSVPCFGYYAYHPYQLKWWQPIPEEWVK